MRNVCVGFAMLVVILFIGCGGGASSSGTSSPTPSSQSSLRVRVVDVTNRIPFQNIAVVLANPDGSIVATGTTDSAEGEITFPNPPANAIVTAAVSYIDGGVTRHEVESFYDVNSPAITLSMPNAPLLPGTIYVNVTDLAGSARWRIYAGQVEIEITPSQNPVSLPANAANLQSNGQISVVVIGYDENHRRLGYGMILDQPYSDGMTVNVTLSESNFIDVPFTIGNAPSSAKAFRGEVDLWRKGGSRVRFWQSILQPFPSSYGPSIASGFADYYNYSAVLAFDAKNSGKADSWIGLYTYSSLLSPQQADFSNTLTIPSNLKVSGSGPGAVISWDGSDLSADYVYVAVNHSTTTESYNYYLYAPPTRSGVSLPQLPAALDNYAPASIDGFLVLNRDSDLYSGYDDFISKIDQAYSGRWRFSSEYKSKMSEAYYSTGLSGQSKTSIREQDAYWKDLFDGTLEPMR